MIKFEKEIIIDRDTVFLSTADNNLVLEIKRLERILLDRTDTLKTSQRDSQTVKETVRNRLPYWIYLVGVGVFVGAFIYFGRKWRLL